MFFKGLITLLPLVITFYVLYSGLLVLENILGNFIRVYLGNNYIPGIGLIATLIFILLFGFFITNFISKSLWVQVEKRLIQVPLIKAVYSPLKDLMGLFSKDGKQDLKSVVLVDLSPGNHVVGLVTRDSFTDITFSNSIDKTLENAFENKKVAVYIPLSYALGGFTILVDHNRITKLDIPVEKALSLAITGWVKSKTEGNE